MKQKYIASLVFILIIVAVNTQAQKYIDQAPTPPMGWNSWNIFHTDINEEKIKQIADVIVSSGLKDAGYSYVVLDDGWMARERDKITGNLVADPVKFPSGLKSLSDYLHSKGLKFGIYGCAGVKTCQKYPGTRGYEYQDARFYASVGADYVKYDWCFTENINAKEAYKTMSRALQTAERPVVFSICEWGVNKPWEWAEPIGNLWRTTEDIYQVFDGTHDYGTWEALGVMTIVDEQAALRRYHGPDHWNDPDMLEVGNGMSEHEDRAHFSMWCILAAPLIMGNDLRNMSSQTKAILTHTEAIAIDQDQLGIQGFRYANRDSVEIWFKPLQNDEWAVCFLNRSSISKSVDYVWKNESVNDEVFHRKLDVRRQPYMIRDVWAKKTIGTTAKRLRIDLASHEAVLYKLYHKQTD